MHSIISSSTYSARNIKKKKKIIYTFVPVQIPLLVDIWPVLNALYHTSLTSTIFCTLAITTERYQVLSSDLITLRVRLNTHT